MSEFDGQAEQQQAVYEELECSNCGAKLKYKAGSMNVYCEYCGTENAIVEQQDAPIEVNEQDLQAFLDKKFEEEQTEEVIVVQCDSCGASSTMEENVTSADCPFCGSPLVLSEGHASRLHKPAYLLPFFVDNKQAHKAFKKWIKGLWFAPNKLKQYARIEGKLTGMYLPYWTYDAHTITHYVGERGTAYYVTQTVPTQVNGKTVMRTQQVRKIRWSPKSGTVHNMFDDILIPATHSLPQSKLNDLEPWNLDKLVNYDEKFLSGIRTEVYQVDVKHGFSLAKSRMQNNIRTTVRNHIGGDEQRIHKMDTNYTDTTFKHILLPVWVSAYRYRDKVYQIIINAQTGEVQGQRPWSKWKIGLLVLAIVAVALTLYFIFR